MHLWLGTANSSNLQAAMPGVSETMDAAGGSMPLTTVAGSAGGGGAQALRKLQTAMDYMNAFVDRTVPAEVVRLFLQDEARRLQVVYESSSPPDAGGAERGEDLVHLLSERVCIPGAVALEVRVDRTTRLGPNYGIHIRPDDAGHDDAAETVLWGMDGGSDPEGAELHGLCVGDLVVRGPGWCWGNEDGGPGRVGEVLELRAWRGRPAKGARVRWRSGGTGLYRWAYDGVFDIAYLKPGERSTRPISVNGDCLHLAVVRSRLGKKGQDADEKKEEQSPIAAPLPAGEAETIAPAAAATEEQAPWRGALRFDGPRSAVTIPDFPAADLTADFTIALWARLDPAALMTDCAGSGSGGASSLITLVARALEGLDDADGVPVHQLLLGVDAGSGQLVLCMQNQAMRTGVRIVASGGRGAVLLAPGRWAHVAMTMEGQRARLYVDGAEVASGLFGGQRLISMGAPLCLGALRGRDDSHWRGHLWDFGLYDRALSASQLHAVAGDGVGAGGGSGCPGARARGSICHLLQAPESVAPEAPAPRMAHNVAVGAGGLQGIGEVQGCMWDHEVEAPVFAAGDTSPRLVSMNMMAGESGRQLQRRWEMLGQLQQQQPPRAWGYRLTVLPIFPSDPAAIARVPLLSERFAALAASYTTGALKLDLALARHVNRVAQQRRWSLDELLACRRFEEVAPKEEDLVRLPLLRELLALSGDGGDGGGGEPVAACRFGMLQDLNCHVREVILLIDLGSIDRPWSVAHLLSRCRGLVYHTVKASCWKKALEATACIGTVVELPLSRSRAAKLLASGRVDEEARTTVFGQAFRTLHGLPPHGLRRADKAWNVLWMGERAQDAGGPYRESWSVFSLELQSSALALLHRTPNGVHAVGQNREQWVLHPGARGELALQLFAFLGKLMGMVMRNGELLHLDLSPLVWKALSGEPLSAPEDLEAVDVEMARSLRLLRDMGPAEFKAAFGGHLDWTCVSTDGRTIELLSGAAAAAAVSYEDRLEYARLVEQYRLHEFDAQAAALRAGLATIVPVRLLALFTWNELEVMVCGLKQVDVNLLRQVTEYSSGVGPEDPHVRFLWQVLEEWTDEERSMFVRFCWGRSRLPLRAEDFPQRFKIQAFGRTPADNYLPVAHTCFFSIELPRYSSLDICRRKLTLAISACTEIDADENAVGTQAAAMGWEE